MLYSVLRKILYPIFAIVYPYKVHGKNNIPKEGKYIVASNHISLLDPIFLVMIFPKTINFLAKKELFDVPILGGFLKKVHVISVDRNTIDRNAVRRSIEVIQNNEILGVFPEGTRSKDLEPLPAKPGVALFALKGECPILPVRIKGPIRLFRKNHIFIGEPFYLDRKKGNMKFQAQYIMDNIIKLGEENGSKSC
ncbi:lysophospholipid acyltransferase family protein [Proteinivorax hydrogeniformans]|uniref:1-acyl-sn-glycerol-3-phosphate acyltransferase n=1 Tax=Proteinivorax hydrogeniformans TaxID=1826727 RepID=A0AAU8HWP1_9FIRM